MPVLSHNVHGSKIYPSALLLAANTCQYVLLNMLLGLHPVKIYD